MSRSSPLKQELRVFLEEAQRTSDAYNISLEREEIGEGTSTMSYVNTEQPSKVISFPRRSISTDENRSYTERGRASVREKLEQSAIRERHRNRGRERKETMASRGVGTPMKSRNDKGKAAMAESETERSHHASQTVSFPRTPSVPPSPPYRVTGVYGMPKYPTEKSLPVQKDDEMLHPRRVARSEDNANMNYRGKGNVDKWLHMLMDDQQEGNEAAYRSSEDYNATEKNGSDDEQEIQSRIDDDESCRNEITECVDEITESVDKIVDVGGESAATHHGTPRCRDSFDIKEEKVERKIWFPRSDSGRGFRSLPSSPSKILGMRRNSDCAGRKPKVGRDDDHRYGYEDSVSTSSSKFLSKCKQAIKKTDRKSVV